MTNSGEVFPIRFDPLARPMVILGFTRRSSRVILEDDVIDIRMGWGFRMRAPRAAVVSAEPDHRLLFDRGVHGIMGRWNVAASARGLVRIIFDPRPRGWVGPFPVRVRRLRVSLEEPEDFLAALGIPRPPG